MELTVNGAATRLAAGTTVLQLVHELSGTEPGTQPGTQPGAVPLTGVAVAVNDEVVPRGAWPQTRLRPGDRVEVLTAAQGG